MFIWWNRELHLVKRPIWCFKTPAIRDSLYNSRWFELSDSNSDSEQFTILMGIWGFWLAAIIRHVSSIGCIAIFMWQIFGFPPSIINNLHIASLSDCKYIDGRSKCIVSADFVLLRINWVQFFVIVGEQTSITWYIWKNLYILYTGQSDFTSNVAVIGIGWVHEYLRPVISQIATTIKALRDRCRKHVMKWRKALFEWTHVKSVFEKLNWSYA